MTVKELKEKLERLDDNLIILAHTGIGGYYEITNVCRGFNEEDGYVFLDDYIEEDCETCMYYNTDKNDQPCCSCIDWENWEKSVN